MTGIKTEKRQQTFDTINAENIRTESNVRDIFSSKAVGHSDSLWSKIAHQLSTT